MQYLGRMSDLDKLLMDSSGLILPGAIYEAQECDVQGSRGWTPETSVAPDGHGGWMVKSHFVMPPACISDTRVPQRVTPGGFLAFTSEAAQ